MVFNWTNDYGPELDPPYYTGDTVTFPLDNVYRETSGTMFFQLFDCLTYWSEEGYSIQAVIWQISYGPTMYARRGWAEWDPMGTERQPALDCTRTTTSLTTGLSLAPRRTPTRGCIRYGVMSCPLTRCT